MSSRSSSSESSRSDSRRGSSSAGREDRVVASVRAKHQDPNVSPTAKARRSRSSSSSSSSSDSEGPEVPIENPRETRSSRRKVDKSRYRSKDKRSRDVGGLDRRVGDERLDMERRQLEVRKMEAELELKKLEIEASRNRSSSASSTSSDGRSRYREGSRGYAPTSKPSKSEPLREPTSSDSEGEERRRKRKAQQEKHAEAKRAKQAAKEKEKEAKARDAKRAKEESGGKGGGGDEENPEEPSERMKLKAVLRLLETEPLAPMRPEVASCGLPNIFSVRKFVAACESELDVLQGGTGGGTSMSKHMRSVFDKLCIIAASASDPAVGARPSNRTALHLGFHRKTSAGPVTLSSATGVVDVTRYLRGDTIQSGYAGVVWGSSAVAELERQQNLLQVLLDAGIPMTDEKAHVVCDLCGDVTRTIDDHYAVAHTDHPNNNTRYFKVHRFENANFQDCVANARGFLNRMTSGMLAADAAKDPKVAAKQREWSTVSTAFAMARLAAHRKGFTAAAVPEEVLAGGVKGGVGGGTGGQTGWANAVARACDRFPLDDQAALRLLLGDTPIFERVNSTLLDRAREYNTAVADGRVPDNAIPSKAPPAAGEAVSSKEIVWQWFADVCLAALQRLPPVPADKSVTSAVVGSDDVDQGSGSHATGDPAARFATLYRAGSVAELGVDGAHFEDPVASACAWAENATADGSEKAAATTGKSGPYPSDMPITWLSISTAVRASRAAVGYLGGGGAGDVLLVLRSSSARDLSGYADYHAGVEAAILPGTWFRSRALGLAERIAMGPQVGAALDAVQVYELTEIDGSTGHGLLATFTSEEVYRNYQLLPLLNVASAPIEHDASGNSALHLAAGVPRNAPVVRTLLTSPHLRDRINAQNAAGETPLHAALSSAHVDVQSAAALLAAGADPLIANAQFVLPLHLALRNPKIMRVGMLLLAMHGGVPQLEISGSDPRDRGLREGLGRITGGLGVRAGEGVPNGLLRVLLQGTKDVKTSISDGKVAGGIDLNEVGAEAAKRLERAGVEMKSFGVTQDTLRTTPVLLGAASPAITADLLRLVLRASPSRLAWQTDQFGSSVLHTLAANPSCTDGLVNELLNFFKKAAAGGTSEKFGPLRPAADGPMRLLNERDGYGLTPLQHLCANSKGCSAAAVKAMLDAGASVVVLQEGAKGSKHGPLSGVVDRDGRSCVARATNWAHTRVDIEVIRILVERSKAQNDAAAEYQRGANVTDDTPAGIAARLRAGETSTTMEPVDIMCATEPGSAPPIHILVGRDDVTVDDVREYSTLGADVNAIGYGGQSLLHVFLRNEAAVRRDCYGEPNASGRSSPKKGSLDILRFLLSNMSSDAINTVDSDGLSAIHHAVSNPASTVMLLDELVSKGANVSSPANTTYGPRTSLQQALSNPRVSAATVGWLISKGVPLQVDGGADEDPEEHPLVLYLDSERSAGDRESEEEVKKSDAEAEESKPVDVSEEDLCKYSLPTGAALDLDVLKLLLEKTGAERCAKLADRQGSNIMHLLMRRTGDCDAMRTVFKALGAKAKDLLSASDHSGRGALAVLCEQDHVSAEAIVLILTQGAETKDPAAWPAAAATLASQADHYGATPLHVLCQNPRVRADLIAALVPPSASYSKTLTRTKDGSGRIAAHCLAANRGLDAHPMPPTGLRVVVRRPGVNDDQFAPQAVLSEEQAARLGVSRTQMVEYGLCAGAVTALAEAHSDFGIVDSDNSSCVHVAAGNPRCTVPIVRVFLNSAHTAANKPNRQGKSAVDIADAVDRRDLKKEIIRHAVGRQTARRSSDSSASGKGSDNEDEGEKQLSDECETRLVSFPDSARLHVIRVLVRLLPALTTKAATKLVSSLPAELGTQKRVRGGGLSC